MCSNNQSVASLGKVGAVVTLLILFFVVNLEEHHPPFSAASAFQKGGGNELRYISGELSLGDPPGDDLAAAAEISGSNSGTAEQRMSKIREALQRSEFYHPSSKAAPGILLSREENKQPIQMVGNGGVDKLLTKQQQHRGEAKRAAAAVAAAAADIPAKNSNADGNHFPRPYTSQENPPFSFEHIIPGTYGPECVTTPGGPTRQIACEFKATLQHIEQCNELETAGGDLSFDPDTATIVWQSKTADGTAKKCGGDEYYIETRPFGSEMFTAPNMFVYFNDHSFIGDGRYEFKMRGYPTIAAPIKGTEFYSKHPMRNLCKRGKHCTETPTEYPVDAVVSPCCPSLRRPMNISVLIRLQYTNGWGMKPPPFKVGVGGPNAINTVIFEDSIMVYTCLRPEELAAESEVGIKFDAQHSVAAVLLEKKEAAGQPESAELLEVDPKADPYEKLKQSSEKLLLASALKAEAQCTIPKGVEKFAHWVFFGDSLTEQMYAVTPSTLGRDPKHNFWYTPRLPSPTNTIHNPHLPLTNDSIARSVYMGSLENFTHPGGPDAYKETAVLMSSGMWEVLSNVHSDLFLGHVDAFADWLDKAIELFPGSTIVVKNVNAVHLHRAEKCNSACRRRLMYMSNSRVSLLNQMQAVEVRKRKLVQFEQFTYTSTVAHRSKRNDARHYNINTNVVLWSILQELMKKVDAESSTTAMCKPLLREYQCVQ